MIQIVKQKICSLSKPVIYFIAGLSLFISFYTYVGSCDLFDYHNNEIFVFTFLLTYCATSLLTSVGLLVLMYYFNFKPIKTLIHFGYIVMLICFFVMPYNLIYTTSHSVKIVLSHVIIFFASLATEIHTCTFIPILVKSGDAVTGSYFTGVSVGAIISTLFRLFTNAVYPTNIENDTFLTYFIPMTFTAIIYSFYAAYMGFNKVAEDSQKEKVSDEESSNSDEAKEMKQNSSSQSGSSSDSENKPLLQDPNETPFSHFIAVLKSVWLSLFSSVIISVVTFAAFPSFLVETKYETERANNTKIDINIVLIFWACDLVFRFIGFIPIRWNTWMLYIATTLRMLFFIPIFDNYFSKDLASKTVGYLMSFGLAATNGYFSTVTMQNISKSTNKIDELTISYSIILSLNIGKFLGSVALFVLFELFQL